MMKNSIFISSLLAMCFALSAFADSAQSKPDQAPQRLNDDQLYAAFVGKSHTGYYRDYLNRYGAIRFYETYNEDGFLVYKGGGIETGGLWDIEDGKICFDYDHPDFLSGCYVVTAQNGCYYSYDVTAGVPEDLNKAQWWIYSHWTVKETHGTGGTKPVCVEEDNIS